MKARFLVLVTVLGLVGVPLVADSITIVETGPFPLPGEGGSGGLVLDGWGALIGRCSSLARDFRLIPASREDES